MKPEMKEIAAKVAAMTEEQRAEIAARMPVITIAGHVISQRNTVLLALQKEEPITIIGGFRQWIEAGRAVRKGEKAAYILRPAMKKSAEDSGQDGAEDGDKGARFFVQVPMFDVSQTDPLPVADKEE